MTRRSMTLRKLLPGIGFVALAGPLAPAAASAAPFRFHVHMDAYGTQGPGYNCSISEWSSTMASCGGFGHNGNAGSAGAFDNFDTVRWCNGSASCGSFVGTKAALPAGYSRWMELCATSDCRSNLIGAVRMPDGPFLVVEGTVDGRAVVRQSESKGVESDGGPLFLYVGYHGSISNGGGVPASQGYVFGFRGYLQF